MRVSNYADPVQIEIRPLCGQLGEDAVVLRWLAGILGSPEPRAEKETEAPSGRVATSKRCRNDLLLGTGYAFRFPSFREGYAALVSEAT